MKKFIIFKIAAILLMLAVATAGCKENSVVNNNGDEEEFQTSEMNKGTENETIENDNNDENILFTEYSLSGTSCRWINLIDYNQISQNGIIIINSNQELEKYIACSDDFYPEIDFSKHNLLLVTGVSWNVITSISKNFQQNSANYVLDVEIIVLKNAIYRQQWTTALVTKKICEDNNLELNVMYSYDEEEEPKFLEIGTGMYIETDPIKGNNILNFIDGERLLYAGYLSVKSEDNIKYDEFNYKINNYTMELSPINDPTITTYHYFRIIDDKKIEIGNIYIINAMGSTIPPIVYFEKQ